MIPEMLLHLLSVLIDGQSKGSLSQDICHSVTRGQWTMPKHFMLGMTVRHITGSAEMITMLNRFGHCSSYSILLELETAMCDSIT